MRETAIETGCYRSKKMLNDGLMTRQNCEINLTNNNYTMASTQKMSQKKHSVSC